MRLFELFKYMLKGMILASIGISCCSMGEDDQKRTADPETPDELTVQLPEEAAQAATIMPLAAALPSTMEDPKQYMDAPFGYNFNNNESVSLNNGSLEYTATDFVLPGKNGMNLAITRRYSFASANTQDYDVGYHTVDTYRYHITIFFSNYCCRSQPCHQVRS